MGGDVGGVCQRNCDSDADRSLRGTSFRVCNVGSVDRDETQLNGLHTDRSLHLAVFQANR